MIDKHSQRINARSRFRVTVRWVTRLVLVSIACSWLFLYFDSVHQRRRAESLFADLKSLDFATAGFPEVRDIMIRNGGTAMQRKLLPRAPDLDNPVVDDHGNVTFPRRPQTTCTPRDRLQNCLFREVPPFLPQHQTTLIPILFTATLHSWHRTKPSERPILAITIVSVDLWLLTVVRSDCDANNLGIPVPN